MTQRDSRMLTAMRAQIAKRDRRIANLENRNAELERYAYTVSHDLKTPLVTIKGFISFLRRDIRSGSSEQVEHDLERISYAADRMKHLLDALLELASVGRGGLESRPMPFAEIVDEALERVAGTLEERQADIQIAPALPEVYGDKTLLVDVIEQLLDNALTHTQATKHSGEPPAPEIEIGARREGPETVLFVRDNGPGIDPRFHEKVFELFERLDPEASEGTGAGLTLVKRIIEHHGGKVWIESSGQGSTMCFSLPGTRGEAGS